MKSYIAAAFALVALTLPAHAEDQIYRPNWPTQQELKDGVKIYEYNRTALAGNLTKFDAITYMTEDCQPDEGDNVVSQKPEHGVAAIEVVNRTTMYIGAYAKCNNGKKYPISTITYKANSGYSGTDSFEVTSVSPRGFTNVYRYTIKVIDRNQKSAYLRMGVTVHFRYVVDRNAFGALPAGLQDIELERISQEVTERFCLACC